MMSRVRVLAGAVFADALRRKVVWVVVLFAAVLAMAIPALPSYGQGIVEAVFREVALAVMYVAVMVVTLALAANRIPSELERRTVYNVLGRGVRRWEYLLGTWLGVVLTVGVVALAFSVVTIGIGWVVYGSPMLLLLEGALGIWLEAGVVAALCIAVAAAAGPVVVSVAALAFLFIGHARAGVLTPESGLVWYLYPSLDAFNIIAPVSHGDGVSPVYLLTMLAVFLAWSALLLVLGMAVFARKDL